MAALPDLIVIDDDPVNNMICVKMLRYLLPDMDIKAFTEPLNAIDHIVKTHAGSGNRLVLFLDIDMPSLSGWEVLRQIALFPAGLQQRIKVLILTSSVDPKDKLTAASNPLVASFITKPLSNEKLKDIFSRHIQ